VKPGQKIQVLDAAVYRETLSINSSTRHRNIVLEAPQQATIEVGSVGGSGILISSVQGVTIRGFRLRAGAAKVNMVQVKGPCCGLMLEELDMDSSGPGEYHGIHFFNVEIPNEAPAAVVRNCVIRRPNFGISILGVSEPDYAYATPCARIALQRNTVISPN